MLVVGGYHLKLLRKCYHRFPFTFAGPPDQAAAGFLVCKEDVAIQVVLQWWYILTCGRTGGLARITVDIEKHQPSVNGPARRLVHAQTKSEVSERACR